MPPSDVTGRSGSSRALPVVLLAIAGLLLVARVGFGIFERTEQPLAPDLVHWREPVIQTEVEAMNENKPLLYDFTAEWCGPCRAMQREVFADARLAAKINAAFIPVRVLHRTREEERNPAAVDTLQHIHHVSAFPTLVITSPDGARRRTLQGWRGAMGTMQWVTVSAVQVMGPMQPEGTPDRSR